MFYDFITKYTDIVIEKMGEAFALHILNKKAGPRSAVSRAPDS